MPKNQDLADRIKAIRQAVGETQELFAPRLGIHRVTLAKLEKGAPIGTAVSKKLTSFVEHFERKVS